MTPGPVEQKKLIDAYDDDDGEEHFELSTGEIFEGDAHLYEVYEKIEKAHEAAIAEAVKAAVERCAKIAEDYCKRSESAFTHLHSKEIARDIRAQAQGATHGRL